MMALYTVVLGAHVYVLTPIHSFGATFAAGLLNGAGQPLLKNSTLAGLLPGTSVKMRSEGGNIYVKVGKRESEYKIVSTQ